MSNDDIGAVHVRLRNLSVRAKSVVLFPPADVRLMSRSVGKLPGPFDEELLSFYQLSNGASLLDYCVAGCKNPRLVDLADHTLNLWAANDLLALDFIGFMTTSAGHEFGYLHDTASKGSHVVAVLPELSAGGLLPIASSVSRFFQGFVRKLEMTVARNPDSLYIAEPLEWPFELREWLREDPDLQRRYCDGELDEYWHGDPALEKVVNQALERVQS
jgi:hypothetical protein